MKDLERVAAAYEELFEKILTAEYLDVGLTRYLLRQAASARYRNLVPTVLDNFEILLPVIREVVIYLDRVLAEKQVQKYKSKFEDILAQEYIALPYVNIWVFYLLQNERFNKINLSINYDSIKRVREKALIAKRKRDTTWVKDYKDGLDVLGPWDKRAILYAASILSPDEMTHWIKLASARGDILDKAIAAYLGSMVKP